MTVARASQLAGEVLRTNTGLLARVTQANVEVLRINTATKMRAGQVAVEVLRPHVPAPAGRRSVYLVC